MKNSQKRTLLALSIWQKANAKTGKGEEELLLQSGGTT